VDPPVPSVYPCGYGKMDVVIRLLNGLLMIVIPLGVGVYIVRRWRLSWRLFMIGAGTFIGSQVLHIPFNQFALLPLVNSMDLMNAERGIPLLLYGLFFGLSAGIFEEGARYLVLQRWLKDARRWEEAVLYGAGHGGVEAILLGGLALFAFFQALAYRNADLAEIVPAEQLEAAIAQIGAYWSAPWYAAILGAVERCLAIVVQITLAVLVFQAILRRNVLWLALAVLWHTAVDAIALIGNKSWGIYPAEGALFLMALASLAILISLRRDRSPEGEMLKPELEARPAETPLDVPADIDLTVERLEESRFDDSP
jgi:uncharacterized membrane protein YhfC